MYIIRQYISGCENGSTLWQIEGDILAVKKALVAVSRRLQDCPPVDKTRMAGSKPLEAVARETLPELRVDHILQRNSGLPTMPSSSISYASGIHPLSVEIDRVPALETNNLFQDVTFKILCSNDRVGGVIGKGGSIVRALQNETGASISVGASIAECDERLITVTASEVCQFVFLFHLYLSRFTCPYLWVYLLLNY